MFAQNHIIGIQGGRGSFNEAAIEWYLTKNKIMGFTLRHLYTTENVLRALKDGEIERGQFAVCNSLGGIVDESLYAMSRYKFEILEKYRIKITHCLMAHKNADPEKIRIVLTHPQALKQCEKNLAVRHSHLRLDIGEGELIDPAKVAALISTGAIPPYIATLSNRAIAQTHGLKIIDDNLQDDENNETTFVLVGPYPKTNCLSVAAACMNLDELAA
jgi:prephenate dehydratase